LAQSVAYHKSVLTKFDQESALSARVRTPQGFR